MIKLTVACLLAFSLPTFAGDRLWIVGDTSCPDVDFTFIQQAILSASDGDSILVRPATHGLGRIEIDQKSLTIFSGEPLHSFYGSIDEIIVRNLLPTQSVTINLKAFPTSGVPGTSSFYGEKILLENNQGPIWIESLQTQFGWSSSNQQLPDEAIRVENCSSVTFAQLKYTAPSYKTACTPGDPCYGADGFRGMVVVDSEVHMFDCRIFGHWGGPGSGPSEMNVPGGDGAGGVLLQNSTLNAYGSLFLGGHGGVGADNFAMPDCVDGGDGAHAVELLDSSSVFRHQDSAFIAGTAGPWTHGNPPDPNGCMDGDAGLMISNTGGGTVTNLAGVARETQISTLHAIQEGEPTGLIQRGVLGDIVFLGFAVDQAPSFDPVFMDTVAFTPLNIITLGVLGASSTKTFPLVVPDLTAPGESTSIYLQTYSFDTNLDLFVGSSTVTMALDSSQDSYDGCATGFFVDDDGPNDPGPGDSSISDPLEDGSKQHPFDTILALLHL